jgi:Biotin-requiring enzyme
MAGIEQLSSLRINGWIRTSSNSSSSSSSSSNDSASSSGSKPSEAGKTDQEILDSIEEIVDVDSKTLDAVIDRSLFTQQIPVTMPDMGDTKTSKVSKWYFAEGDVVPHGSVLCDIETPGFTFGMEIEDEEMAIMGETLVELGQDVPVNSVICHLYHEAEKKSDKDKKDDDESGAVSPHTKDSKDKDDTSTPSKSS